MYEFDYFPLRNDSHLETQEMFKLKVKEVIKKIITLIGLIVINQLAFITVVVVLEVKMAATVEMIMAFITVAVATITITIIAAVTFTR